MENFFDYVEKKYSFDKQQDFMLLEYAVGNNGEALRILKEEIEGKKKNLLYYYPGVDGELDLSGYNPIGTIPDGVLLMEK
jgi:hypothetical protein